MADGNEAQVPSVGPTDPDDQIAQFDKFGMLAEDFDHHDDTDKTVPKLLLLELAIRPLAKSAVKIVIRGSLPRPIYLTPNRAGWLAWWGPLPNKGQLGGSAPCPEIGPACP
jgi:hypothetical protein